MHDHLGDLIASATPVDGVEAIGALSMDTRAVLVAELSDSVVLGLLRLPNLQALVHGGHSSLTDAGLRLLQGLRNLEALDLEWTPKISGSGLQSLSKLTKLRWVDLSFCERITREDVNKLQRLLPACRLEYGDG